MRYSIGLAVCLGSACVGKADAPPNPGHEGRSETSSLAHKARPSFVKAPEGDVTVALQTAMAAARDLRVVAYVGAEWCEPCTRFHRAVEAGELDAQLSGVQFVEFDSDHDRERLSAAGYDGRLIPRFVVPAVDGTPSGRRTEGGVKGAEAVPHIMARLQALLDNG